MAISFAGYRTLPFRGATSRLPVKLPQGVAVPANRVPPSVCPVEINWLIYWNLAGQPADLGVAINLQAASVQASILDRIASVKIDNSGSPNPVYVHFPDTNDVIACPPNTTVTFPCLTNLLNATIIIRGLSIIALPITRVFFYNVDLPPAVDPEINNALALWKASPSIIRDNQILNTSYGTPALGDQYECSNQLALTGFVNVVLWGTPYPTGFIYLQDFEIRVTALLGSAVQSVGQIRVSTDTGTILMAPSFFAQPDVTKIESGAASLVSMYGMNVKLDATKTWRATCIVAIPQGTAQVHSSFTKAEI